MFEGLPEWLDETDRLQLLLRAEECSRAMGTEYPLAIAWIYSDEYGWAHGEFVVARTASIVHVGAFTTRVPLDGGLRISSIRIGPGVNSFAIADVRSSDLNIRMRTLHSALEGALRRGPFLYMGADEDVSEIAWRHLESVPPTPAGAPTIGRPSGEGRRALAVATMLILLDSEPPVAPVNQHVAECLGSKLRTVEAWINRSRQPELALLTPATMDEKDWSRNWRGQGEPLPRLYEVRRELAPVGEQPLLAVLDDEPDLVRLTRWFVALREDAECLYGKALDLRQEHCGYRFIDRNIEQASLP